MEVHVLRLDTRYAIDLCVDGDGDVACSVDQKNDPDWSWYMTPDDARDLGVKLIELAAEGARKRKVKA